ncbi:V-type ATP synthase subunit E [Acetivibrio straminisolvens]|jgi:V/A-type H+-transporting ATPase subunit E|uniref:V-type proton ATPase subunit E n=1 Tax=Acetivibrio straminisolvens JCM 21531 TaxID=1294263 RepID=W4V3F7_9FIRM|nr:V-type ATP synthase subunit E family protein [Acetivibrio straminisolvens]GAE87741.1 v-type ATP synthase subunit E [Acetivibrio straminisolvens JCM 21531]
MAGVEKIKERIIEEARAQAEANIKRAQEEAAKIIETAQKEADAKKAQILEKAKKEAVDVKKRLKAMAELEARKKKLQARQEVVEEAFNKAIEKLNSLPDREYEEIISRLIINSVQSGTEEIILSPKDKQRISAGFIENINKKLSEKGIDGKIRLSEETKNISGGFILKSGDIEINNSFEAIIRMKREEVEAQVIKALF